LTVWIPIRDQDPRAYGFYKRHYSARFNANKPRQRANGGRNQSFVGWGDYLALMTPMCDALFVWKNYGIGRDGQVGVVCSVFRNESEHLSSALVLEAEHWAREKWGSVRLYTYVDATAIKSKNAGYCFKVAGWRKAGTSKRGLILLEKTG
jgi:hypothetical protein